MSTQSGRRRSWRVGSDGGEGEGCSSVRTRGEGLGVPGDWRRRKVILTTGDALVEDGAFVEMLDGARTRDGGNLLAAVLARPLRNLAGRVGGDKVIPRCRVERARHRVGNKRPRLGRHGGPGATCRKRDNMPKVCVEGVWQIRQSLLPTCKLTPTSSASVT